MTNRLKKLPIGISDFKEVIEENCYYIDKTLFIEEIKRTNGKIILITRPRRFGKTLNLSLLRYFFEKTEVSNEYLFHDLAIWHQEKYRKFQGQYPVIYLTFKSIKPSDWDSAYEEIVEVIRDEFNRHADYLLPKISKQDLQDYEAILSRTASKSLYANSLFFLSRLLKVHYKKRVIILLDEYDGPIHAAYHHGYYNKLIEFMRSLLTTTFKDNSYLERGVLTGILRAAKEGIFSGLNNLRTFSVLEKKFSDKFGFTQEEMEQFLGDYKLLKHQHAIKEWYDGYKCGLTHHLYNPWSALECIDNQGELLPYWVNTSDNQLVKKLIAKADQTIKTEFATLLSDGSIEKEIKDTVIIPGIENDSKALWSLLLFSGYATFSKYKIDKGKKICTLVLPNKEINLLFEDLIQSIFEESLAPIKLKYLQEAILAGDALKFGELLQEFVLNSMSVFDIPEKESEKSYHLFVLGLLVLLSENYEVKSNRESGYGRYDIMLIPVDSKKPAIIIEFKKASTLRPEPLSDLAQKALDQIIEKKYHQELELRKFKNIVGFGIAFSGKELDIASQKLL